MMQDYIIAWLLLLVINRNCYSLEQLHIGEEFTINCSIDGSNSFRWEVDSAFEFQLVIPDEELSMKLLPFTTTTVMGLSVLKGIACSNLDGSLVRCTNSSKQNERNITIEILGNPISYVDIHNKSSLEVILERPRVEIAKCIQLYQVVISDSEADELLPMRLNNTNNRISTYTATFTGLNLCKHIYAVTVYSSNSYYNSNLDMGMYKKKIMEIGNITIDHENFPFSVDVSNSTRTSSVGNGDDIDIIITVNTTFDECLNTRIEAVAISNPSTSHKTNKTLIKNQPIDLVIKNIPRSSNYTCCVDIVLPSKLKLKVMHFECHTYVPTIASTMTTSVTSQPVPPLSDSNIGVLIVLVVTIVIHLTAIVVVVILVVARCFKKRAHKGWDETISKVVKEVPKESQDFKSQDKMPTYQDPNLIEREVAGSSGDIYRVVNKKGKGSKKEKQNDDVGNMYSVVDKIGAKHEEKGGQEYAEIDVKNSSKSSRSHLSPSSSSGSHPAGCKEPVAYSTMEITKH